MPGSWISALEQGALLLTATRRLARGLREQYDRAQRAAGRTAWESPRIDALGDWLAERWQERVEDGGAPTLLSEAQVGALWEQVLAEDEAAHPGLTPVLSLSAATDAASRAWTLWHTWQLPDFARHPHLSQDGQAFLRWAAEFRRRCDRSGWTDAARVPAALATWWDGGGGGLGGGSSAGRQVLLAGFDDLPTGHKAVFAALERRGCTIENVPEPAVGAQAHVAAFEDSDTELAAAARWARHWLEQGEPGPIAIVLPDLDRQRDAVVRHLREWLTPGALIEGDPRAMPYNLSAGPPLALAPLVRTALMALALQQERLTLDVLGHVLRTPFLAGGESERLQRGLLEARLRELGELEPPTSALAGFATPGDEPRPYHSPVLAQALRRAQALTLPRTQGAAGWSRSFTEWLTALGWPGERALDSAEHQAREKWQDALEGLASLERVVPPMTWSDALARLRKLADDTAFQPESGAAPVQVLGLLESGGLTFTHLWVAGLDDNAWPAAAHPNPFLPAALQRQHALPHASAAWELAWAQRHVERLRQAAPNVWFTHARRNGDEGLRPSPLLAAIPRTDTVPQSAIAPLTARFLASARGEAWPDDPAPPLAAGSALGGTSVFRDMAACPFRAFANHRLHARTLEEPAPGLGPDKRGQLTHRALELLWQRLNDHAGLTALTPEGARLLAQESAQTALGDCEQRWRRRLAPALAEIERRRLAALLLETMEIERQRAPFRVAEREAPRNVTLGGVTVHVQVDRMDEVRGGRVLVDYKTGPARVSSWFSDRPDEPQLPIYAVDALERGDNVTGVGFFHVKRGESRFVGLAEPSVALPDAADFVHTDKASAQTFMNRGEVFDHWRETLDALGRRFAAGESQVDPKDPASTCRYCLLPALCRVGVLRRAGTLAPLEDADGEE